MLRSLGVSLLCALLAFLVLGVQAADTDAAVDPAAQHALDAVTTETFNLVDPQSEFPRDFSTVMGYRPAIAVGPKGNPIMVKPTGDCSAFAGDTKYTFGRVCMEHDLAYDILRYSAAVDRPLPADSRRQADAMFRRELHNNCGYSGWTGADLRVCHFWAESFALAVEFNSWRQGFQPPRLSESLARWEACVALFFGLLVSRRTLEELAADPVDMIGNSR